MPILTLSTYLQIPFILCVSHWLCKLLCLLGLSVVKVIRCKSFQSNALFRRLLENSTEICHSRFKNKVLQLHKDIKAPSHQKKTIKTTTKQKTKKTKTKKTKQQLLTISRYDNHFCSKSANPLGRSFRHNEPSIQRANFLNYETTTIRKTRRRDSFTRKTRFDCLYYL